MKAINILLAGVGGQGLVLTTKIISEVALKAGYDVKTNDVVGLSQRGGKVWGNVRIGKKIHSPNIPPNDVDFLLAMEPLEAERWLGDLNKNSFVIVNTYQVPPTPVLMEQEKYPVDIVPKLKKICKVIYLNATNYANELGSEKVANVILVGILAKQLSIDLELWHEGITKNVPKKYVAHNIKAFEYGYNLRGY